MCYWLSETAAATGKQQPATAYIAESFDNQQMKGKKHNEKKKKKERKKEVKNHEISK